MNTQSVDRRRLVASSVLLPVPLLLLGEVVLADFIGIGGSVVVAAPSMLLVGAATWAASPTIARGAWGRRFLLYLALCMGIIVVSSVLSHAVLSVFRSRHLQGLNVPFFITLFGVPFTLAAYTMHAIFRSYFFAS